MNEKDIWVMDGIRRDVDRDIKEMLADSDEGVSIVEWWDILGFDNDLTVTEIRKMRLLERRCSPKCPCEQVCCRFIV
jgi:hypothetical protein